MRLIKAITAFFAILVVGAIVVPVFAVMMAHRSFVRNEWAWDI